jgi:hypothetical protein
LRGKYFARSSLVDPAFQHDEVIPGDALSSASFNYKSRSWLVDVIVYYLERETQARNSEVEQDAVATYLAELIEDLYD